MVEIRSMDPSDIPEVCRILADCFRWVGAREGFTSEQLAFLIDDRSSEETVTRESQKLPHFVALQDGRLAGLLVVSGNEIARLYVDPVWHRRGIGRSLLEHAFTFIREAGHQEARVGAIVDSARTFYQAAGMKPMGQVPWMPEIFGERQVTILTRRL